MKKTEVNSQKKSSLDKKESKKINKKNIIIIIILIIIALISYMILKPVDPLAQYRVKECGNNKLMKTWTELIGGVRVKSCTSDFTCKDNEKIHHKCAFGGERFGAFQQQLLQCELICVDENKVILEEREDVYIDTSGGTTFGKPVIYLYPEKTSDVEVTLEFKGEIFADYPTYDKNINGWNVIASADSTLINKADNKEYSYLFWEGHPEKEIDWNLEEGFIVQGSDAREFLQDTLPKMGLTPKEYNEFIVYWYPIMQENEYNLIHFAGEQYTSMAPLETKPAYDSLLRVFMVIKPLDEAIKIKPQTFEKFERKGFSVVEWGGVILDKQAK